jgi:hypothetical protein
VCAGLIHVSVAGIASLLGASYDYQVLIRPPRIDSVVPLVGHVPGGDEVTLTGSGFGDASVYFVERRVDLTVTGVRGECVWRGIPGMSCNDTFIRYVRAVIVEVHTMLGVWGEGAA